MVLYMVYIYKYLYIYILYIYIYIYINIYIYIYIYIWYYGIHHWRILWSISSYRKLARVEFWTHDHWIPFRRSNRVSHQAMSFALRANFVQVLQFYCLRQILFRPLPSSIVATFVLIEICMRQSHEFSGYIYTYTYVYIYINLIERVCAYIYIYIYNWNFRNFRNDEGTFSTDNSDLSLLLILGIKIL